MPEKYAFSIKERVTTEAEIELLLTLYREAVAVTSAFSPIRQYLHPSEFIEHLTSGEVIKVLIEENGQVIGILTFTNNLNLCPWLSIPFFEKNFPEDLKSGRLYYNISMAIRKDHHKSGANKHLLRFGYQYIFGLAGKCLVDFSEKTTGGESWGAYMADFMNATIDCYDRQLYTILAPKA